MTTEALQEKRVYGRRLRMAWQALSGVNPFAGSDIMPTRVPLFAPFSGRPTLPFPHPWNYQHPIGLMDTFFHGVDAEQGGGRHNRYLHVPGFSPVLITRDKRIIRAITTETGDKPGQFDRSTLPTDGIARATGEDTLLYANGKFWRDQKKLAAPPFGKTTLFQPEQFEEFAATFRATAVQRLHALDARLAGASGPFQVALEPEIKTVMLEMLTNNFFGCELSYDEVRNYYVPAIERVIDSIVRDTIVYRLTRIERRKLPGFTAGIRQLKADFVAFNKLTDIVLAQRERGTGLWRQFKSDVPSVFLRSNIKVFLAGALEATTSYASWALSHLARHPEAQERVYSEVKDITDYTPEALDQAVYLGKVLDETLRLTPALYFLPRRATVDARVETDDGVMCMPKGTHVLLDVWHANRAEDQWGVSQTGFPAMDFAPDRWDHPGVRGSKNFLHFGFGHGPRVCPGKHLGQLETALVVGAFVKLFRFKAVQKEAGVRAGVSTKPADGVLLEIVRRK